MELLYITWNPSLTIGPFRWYSLCWLIGLALAYFVVRKLYKEQKIKDELFDPLFIYCFLGILIGARLGHCIFYQPDYFLTSFKGFVEMLLPIHIMQDGSWKMTGYAGLASHGGTAGLMLALWLYTKRTKLSIWTVLDNIAIATGTTACFIRLGNLMNSEIIGKATDVPWAFIFEKVDPLPRHPGQLYEAIAYVGDLQEQPKANNRQPNAPGRHWLVLRFLPDVYLHLPLPHRIHQGDSGSLRGLVAYRYGTDTFDSLHRPRCLLYDSGKEKGITMPLFYQTKPLI